MKTKTSIFKSLSVEMNIKELEDFMVVTIPQYCSRSQTLLKVRSKMYGKGLAEKYMSQDFSSDEYELEEILLILTLFLEKAPSSLSLDIVKQVHTFIGHIKGLQQCYDGAIQSFLKVLLIETPKRSSSSSSSSKSSSSSTAHKNKRGTKSSSSLNKMQPKENIYTLLTTHRLALMYGMNRNYLEAISLLEKVLTSYKNSNVKEHHNIYVNASKALLSFQGDFTTATSNSVMLPSSTDFATKNITFSSTFKSKAAKKGGHVTVESISLQSRKKGRFFGVGRRRSSM